MTATALKAPRFVRRTQLGPNEYRKNFRQIDEDIIAAVSSEEADRVTPLMSKIYLRLVSAPTKFRESEGVLYFSAGEVGGRPVKASKVLYEVLGVSSATAHKALAWMHERGIIGYFAGKNGAGLRVFLNRAAGSIGVRARPGGEKILRFGRGSNGAGGGSKAEPAFNDSYAVIEVVEKDLIPHAPKIGAEHTEALKKHPDPRTPPSHPTRPLPTPAEGSPPQTAPRLEAPVEEIVSRLKRELEPPLRSAAREAAAREHERTREWLESKGLPKAARVAQREAYNVLRQHGLISASPRRADSGLVGVRREPAPAEAGRLSPEEVRELAETCVAMLEVHGQGIDRTLSQLSAEVGGPLLAEDVPQVRELAAILAGGGRRE